MHLVHYMHKLFKLVSNDNILNTTIGTHKNTHLLKLKFLFLNIFEVKVFT